MADGKDNGCCGPLDFEDVTLTNVTIKGNLTLDDIGWLCDALGPCINTAIAGLNITAPPVNLTAGGVLTGTLGNAHLNATMAATELNGQTFTGITVNGSTVQYSDINHVNISQADITDSTVNNGSFLGGMTFDAASQANVVALTSRYNGHNRGGVLKPGVPINVSDLMLRYDDLSEAISTTPGLYLRTPHLSGDATDPIYISGNISFGDDAAKQSITGLLNDCNGTAHVPNATIPTCDQMYAAIANITIPPSGGTATKYMKRTLLTTSGTYTTASKKITVKLVSGGGGSPGVANLDANGEPIFGLPGGGGGGGYAEAEIACKVGTVISCTVGAGGLVGEDGGHSYISVNGKSIIGIFGGHMGLAPGATPPVASNSISGLGGARSTVSPETIFAFTSQLPTTYEPPANGLISMGMTTGFSNYAGYPVFPSTESAMLVSVIIVPGEDGGPGTPAQVVMGFSGPSAVQTVQSTSLMSKDVLSSGWGGKSFMSSRVISGVYDGNSNALSMGRSRHGIAGGWGSGAAAAVGVLGTKDGITNRITVPYPDGAPGADGVIIIEEWV